MPSTNHSQRLTPPFWTPVRLALTAMVLSLVAAFGVSSCHSADEVSRPNSSLTTAPINSARNVPSPPAALATLPASVLDAELKAASGAPIKLSNYSGKVLLVNLWATWCGPCRVETPELVKLHKEFRSKGLEMIGLSTEDPEASAESVKNFVDAFEVDYRIGWATRDVQITFMRLTGRDAIPQSFLISRDGYIVRRFVGFSPTSTPPQLKQAIEEALNNKAKV
jgi:cytochrome c biogenesis protein CcmG/thiol:disulfide interchange protein DsbE